MLARRRLGGADTVTVHVPHRLTRHQAALALSRHPRYEPGRGISERYALALITETLAADPAGAVADRAGLTGCETEADAPPALRGQYAAYAGALADVGRWKAFAPAEPRAGRW